MTKKQKKVLSLLLCLVMVLSMAIPQNTIISKAATGKWDATGYLKLGTVTATLTADGVLTISGSGTLNPARSEDRWSVSKIPWYSVRTSISKVVIEEGITDIETFALYGLTNLKTLIFPDSLTKIKWDAISGCQYLKTLHIGKNFYTNKMNGSVTGFFGGSPNLITVTISDENAYFKMEDGVVFSKDGTKLLLYPAGRADLSYVIPNGVNSIGVASFYNSGSKSKLANIVIPESVQNIGDYAFCSSTITEVELPDSVKTIGKNAFDGCKSLKSVTFPKYVDKIQDSTFENCTSLSDIEFSNSLKTIGDSAFKNNSSLIDVEIPESVISLGASSFENCKSLVNAYFYNSATTIGTGSFPKTTIVHGFNSSTAKSYANANGLVFELIEDTVPSIDIQTLTYDKANSKDVSFKVNLGIGDLKATGITELQVGTEVIDPSLYSLSGSTVTVKAEVFKDIKSGTSPFITVTFDDFEETTLKKVKVNVIGESVPTILNTWTLGNITATLDSEGILTVSGTGDMPDFKTNASNPWYNYRTDIKGIVIKDGITSIGRSNFEYTPNATTVSIGKDVVNIGISAFAQCGVVNLVLPENIKKIGSSAFNQNQNLTDLVINCENVTYGAGIFQASDKLVNVTLPESLEVIPDRMFYACKSLENVNVGHITELGEQAFSDTAINKDFPNLVKLGIKALMSCVNFNGKLPKITEVPDWALSECPKFNQDLSAIKVFGNFALSNSTMFNDDLSNAVSIGDSAFRNTGIVNLNLNNVTSVGGQAFTGCTLLETVTFGDKPLTIGDFILNDSPKLREVTLGSDIVSWNQSLFGSNTSGNITLTVLDKDFIYSKYSLLYKPLLLKGYSKSTSETYALANNIPFEAIDGGTETPEESTAPSIEEQTKIYDKLDIDFTIDFGSGNKSATDVDEIVINGNTLVKNVDYSVNDNIITINKTYLDALEDNMEYTLSVKFNDINNTTIDDKLTITIPKEVIPGVAPSVDTQGLTYSGTDVKYTVNLGDGSLKATMVDKVYVNGVAIAKTYWIFNEEESTVTINDTYLKKLRAGSYTIGFLFDDGASTFVEDNCSLDVEETTDNTWVNTATSVLNITWLKGTVYDLLMPTGINNAASVKSLIINDDLIEQEGYSFDTSTGILRIKADVMNRYETGTTSMLLNLNIGKARAIATTDCGIIVAILDKGSSGLIFEKDESTGDITINGNTGSEEVVVIPPSIDGDTVTKVEDVKNDTVTKVEIPGTVTEIAPGAVGNDTEISAPSGSAGEDYANNNGNNFTPTLPDGNGDNGDGNVVKTPSIPKQDVKFNLAKPTDIVISGVDLGSNASEVSYIIIGNYKINKDGTIVSLETDNLDTLHELTINLLEISDTSVSTASGSAIDMPLTSAPFTLDADGKLIISAELLSKLGFSENDAHAIKVGFDDGTIIEDAINMTVTNDEETTDGSTGGNNDGSTGGNNDGSTGDNTDGSTGDNTDGSTDGSTGGNNGGSTGGNTDGSTGGSGDNNSGSGGNNGDSGNNGSTGGNNDGSTGGSTGGNNGGSGNNGSNDGNGGSGNNGSNDGNGTGDTTENENTGAETTEKPTTDVSVDAGNNSDIDLPFDKDVVGDVIINNDKNNIIGNVSDGNIHINGDNTAKLPNGNNNVQIVLPKGEIVDTGYNIVVENSNINAKNVPYLSVKKVIYKGSKFQLNFSNLTENAKVTYKSSNSKIASVSKKGIITAKKAGKAIITVTINQNGKMTISKIEVSVPKSKGKTISEKSYARVKSTVGQPILELRKKLVINKLFSVSIENLQKGEVTYASSNSEVVNVSSKGVLKAKKKGKAIVTITIVKNNVTYTYKLKCNINK